MADQAEELRQMFDSMAKGNEKKSEPAQSQGDDLSTVLSAVPKISGTYIITIASGKGGVGKSTLTVNLGLLLAQKGKKVTIMDADFGLANINVILGVLPKYTLFHVFKGQKKLNDILINVDTNFDIIAGASGIRQMVDLSDDERNNFIKEMESLNHKDYLLIDVGAGISENVLSMMNAANESFVITTPEPTAIADAYGIIKAMASYKKGTRINLIINRVKSIMEAKHVAHRIINIARQFLKVKVNYLGFVFEDKAVEKSIRKQEPLVYNYIKSKAHICLDDIVDRILKIDIKKHESGLRYFLKKFLELN